MQVNARVAVDEVMRENFADVISSSFSATITVNRLRRNMRQNKDDVYSSPTPCNSNTYYTLCTAQSTDSVQWYVCPVELTSFHLYRQQEVVTCGSDDNVSSTSQSLQFLMWCVPVAYHCSGISSHCEFTCTVAIRM